MAKLRYYIRKLLLAPVVFAPLAASGADESVQSGGTAWEPLPEVKYEQREIDGKKWTEGLSKLAMGRFAVNSVNGLMTESVNDYWFYKSFYDIFSYGGYPRDYFDFHVPGMDELPQEDKLAGDWSYQTRDRVYEGGRTVKLITGVLAPGFLVETNAPWFTLTKRDVEWDRSDWKGAIPEYQRHGVFPLMVLIPREGGKVELVTRERGEWNTPKDLGVPAEPWIVAIYPPVARKILWNLSTKTGKFEEEAAPWTFPNYTGDDAVAVLMTFREGVGLRTQLGELTLHSPDKKEIGTVGLSTAFDGLLNGVRAGLQTLKVDPGEVLTSESMAEKWKDDKWDFKPVVQRATALAKLLRNYPLAAKEWFRIDAENTQVQIRNEFTYHKWGGKEWRVKDYAPVPAAFALSHQGFGWPAFEGITDPGIRGRHGPFLYFADQNWCEWSIPLFFPEYALQPAVAAPERDALIKEIQKTASEDNYASGGKQAVRKADLERGSEAHRRLSEEDPRRWGRYRGGWKPWTLAAGRSLAAWALMDDATREAALHKMRVILRYSFSNEEYFRKKEPISGHEYANSAPNVEKPGYMAGDVPSSMGGPLYFGYLYAKFSGDWDFLKPYYRESWDINRFAEIYADWAWPGISLREHVFVSHFDPMNSGVVGLVGLERMSNILGTPEEHARAQYLLSRTASTIAIQALLPRWVDPKNETPAWTCDGASEHGPMLLDFERLVGTQRWKRSYFAWAWLGQQPELYRYRQQMAGARFWKDYQEKFVNSDKWDWMVDFASIVHAAMRGWIRDWPREDFQKFLASDRIYSEKSNGLLPNVDALMLLWARMNNVPAFLVNWEPGTVKTFSWDEKSGSLSLAVNLPKEGQVTFRSWNTLPDETRVNGTAASPVVKNKGIPVGISTPRDEMGPIFALSLPAGPSEIILTWKTPKQVAQARP